MDQHLLAKPLETFSGFLMKGVNVVKERKACLLLREAAAKFNCALFLHEKWLLPGSVVCCFAIILSVSIDWGFYSCTNKRLGAFRPGNRIKSMIQWLHAGRSSSLQSFCLPAAPPSSPWDYLTL